MAAHDAARTDDGGVDDGLDRRAVLRRLAVGGAVVWTAPLISKAAFAVGPTSCTSHVVDWDDFTTGSTFTSATVGGITMSVNSPDFFGGSSALSRDRVVQDPPFGAINKKSVMFEQKPVTGGGQHITFSFSQTVYAVSFTITDIDNFSQSGNGWSDRIVVTSPATFSYTVPAGSNIIGNGTSTGTTTTTGPFRNSNSNNNYQDDSPAGNIDIYIPGPITSFGFDFSCASIQNGSNQRVNFSAISFCG